MIPKKFFNIHRSLLENSKPFDYLHKLIKDNGVQGIKKTNLDLFSFICKTIISQQISNKAANNIWGNIQSILKEKNILLNVLIKNKEIKNIGFSKKKLSYMLKIHEAFKKNIIEEFNLSKLNHNEFKKELTKFKGIGGWTCDMIGIFYFQNLNIWTKNDLVIKKMVEKVNKNLNKKINYEEIFEPYLSILALHLWKLVD